MNKVIKELHIMPITITMLVFLTMFSSSAFSAGDTKIVNVNVDPGTSQENSVACGFELIEKMDTELILNLYSPSGTIVKSELVSCSLENQWTKIDEKQWKLTSVDPNDKYWCVIKVKISGKGNGGEGDSWRWVSVSDIDLDGDTDNNSIAPHRPPSESDAEDLKEYPISTDEIVIGLIVPLNDDNDIAWDKRDDFITMDRDKDDDILDLKLKISAKKKGHTQYLVLTGKNDCGGLWWYDDAGNLWLDEKFDNTVAIGDYAKTSHVEAYCLSDSRNVSSSGSAGEIKVAFDPDAPHTAYGSHDKMRYLIVGTDIDVNSNNSKKKSPVDDTYWEGNDQDFYENHPVAELKNHPEFKNGMLVPVNDNSDDGTINCDNGWNGKDWTGPKANTVEAKDDDLRPLVIRALHLGNNDSDFRRKGMDVLEPRIILKQVSGLGALRIFTTGDKPVVVWDNTSKGMQYKLPNNISFWDALKGNIDLNLQVEGLKPGEVILEIALQLQGEIGPVIHRDRVRITVCGFDLDVNNNGKLGDSVDGIYGYLPGYDGAKAMIMFKATATSVEYAGCQQMNLVATGGPNITSIAFRIIEPSHEPGFCMNSSDYPDTHDDDYSFSPTAKDRGRHVVDTADGMAVQPLYCKDYGGYCTVQVVFMTDNNGVLTLERKIPRDSNNNDIADVYSGDISPDGTFDGSDDNDGDPKSDTTGDGLTRYQEYRGFIISNIHIRTNPTKKNLFIYDRNSILSGSYFNTVGLAICVININEWSGIGEDNDKRVINMRQESHASKPQFHQHGLYLTDAKLENSGYLNWGQSYTVNPLDHSVGSPKQYREIRIDCNQIRRDMTNDKPTLSKKDRAEEAVAYIIAHELSHGVNVSHHAPDVYAGEDNCIMRYIFPAIYTFKKSNLDDAENWDKMTIPNGMCDRCRKLLKVTDSP